MAEFDAGSPRGGSWGRRCCQRRFLCCTLLALAMILSAFLTGACLSDGWLMNWGYSYLWERRIAYFTHVTVLIRKVWQHLFRSMYRHQIHKRTPSKIAVMSPLQHPSPQEIKQPSLEFLSEVQREEGKTRPSSLTFMKGSTKYKLVSQAFWHGKSRHYLIWKNTSL